MRERIREIMEKMGLTQQEFAGKLDLSPASLSSIFTGRTNPTNNHVVAIHKAFPNININWLIFGEGNMLTTESISNSDQSIISPIPVEEDNFILSSKGINLKEDDKINSVNKDLSKNNGYNIGESSLNINLNNIDKKEKRAREIRIFYDDGTYEIFLPMVKNKI